MKPKYLMQAAYKEIAFLMLFGILSLTISIHMLVNGNMGNAVVVALAVFLMVLMAVKALREIEYCLLDEKGITFFAGTKRHSFVSWESIIKVELREYGFGRTYEARVLIYNDEFNNPLISNSDTLEAGCARSFAKVLGNDAVFVEYLKYYRADLKITETCD